MNRKLFDVIYRFEYEERDHIELLRLLKSLRYQVFVSVTRPACTIRNFPATAALSCR